MTLSVELRPEIKGSHSPEGHVWEVKVGDAASLSFHFIELAAFWTERSNMRGQLKALFNESPDVIHALFTHVLDGAPEAHKGMIISIMAESLLMSRSAREAANLPKKTYSLIQGKGVKSQIAERLHAEGLLQNNPERASEFFFTAVQLGHEKSVKRIPEKIAAMKESEFVPLHDGVKTESSKVIRVVGLKNFHIHPGKAIGFFVKAAHLGNQHALLDLHRLLDHLRKDEEAFNVLVDAMNCMDQVRDPHFKPYTLNAADAYCHKLYNRVKAGEKAAPIHLKALAGRRVPLACFYGAKLLEFGPEPGAALLIKNGYYHSLSSPFCIRLVAQESITSPIAAKALHIYCQKTYNDAASGSENAQLRLVELAKVTSIAAPFLARQIEKMNGEKKSGLKKSAVSVNLYALDT